MNRLIHDVNQNRERIIRQYIEALDIGDIDAQDRFLAEAMAFSAEQGDDGLEATLWEVQMAIGTDLQAADIAAQTIQDKVEAEQVLRLAQASFATPAAASLGELQAKQAVFMADDEALEEPPPLTLRDVAARLRMDIRRVSPRLAPAVRDLVTHLEIRHGAVPVDKADLSERGARSLLSRLGIETASSWLGKQFHEAILSLQILREQELRLAAARRSWNQQLVKVRETSRGYELEETSTEAEPDPQGD